MKKRPECGIEGCENGAVILCNIKGAEKPAFVCWNCYRNSPKVKGRVRVP